MASWWNRMPQYSGLFDYQNVMRPAYFTFEVLARITGDRLEATSNDDSVHAFLAYDQAYATYNLLLWNFSAEPVTVKLDVRGLKEVLIAHRRLLDAESASADENARLRPLPDSTLEPDSQPSAIQLAPYDIQSWAIEPLHWTTRLLAQ
jgi:xylan 1,4-beta-xylosidase